MSKIILSQSWTVRESEHSVTLPILIATRFHPNYFSAFFSSGLIAILAYLQMIHTPAEALTALTALTGLKAYTLLALGVIVVVLTIFERGLVLSVLYNLLILFYALAVLQGTLTGRVSPLGVLSFWYAFNIALNIGLLTAYQIALKQAINNHLMLRGQVNKLIK